MAHNQEKSKFLAEETWRSEGLAAQLSTAHQEVVELALATQEVADL